MKKKIQKKHKLAFKREFSAGGAVYKTDNNKILWLVGKHSGYQKWVLPKGLIEGGEKGIETALREVEEEMGVKARIISDKPTHSEQYWFVAQLKDDLGEEGKKSKPIRRVAIYQENPGFKESADKLKIFKTVNFYLMEYVSGDPINHDWEMSEAGWFGYEEAREKLAFEGEKEALRKAAAELDEKRRK